jgi:hypothetical protein
MNQQLIISYSLLHKNVLIPIHHVSDLMPLAQHHIQYSFDRKLLNSTMLHSILYYRKEMYNGPKTEPRSIYWAQLRKFHLKTKI